MPLHQPAPEDRFWGSVAPEPGPTRFFLFGAPLDLTGSGRLGTGQAPSAVRRASHNIESYSPVLDADLHDTPLLADLGDLRLDGLSMEAALAEIEQQTTAVLTRPTPPPASLPKAARERLRWAPSEGLRTGPSSYGVPVVVGGEHTIALAIGRTVKRRYPDAVIVSLDAHLDLADELNDLKVAHGTWVCRLGEEVGGLGDVVLLGMRSGTRDEWRRARGAMWQSPEVALPDHVRARIGARPVYLSVDIDVLDPAAAPGTGTPEPPGISTADLFRFVYALRGLNVVALDVNEILPAVDPAGVTAITGAKLIREAVLLLAEA